MNKSSSNDAKGTKKKVNFHPNPTTKRKTLLICDFQNTRLHI